MSGYVQFGEVSHRPAVQCANWVEKGDVHAAEENTHGYATAGDGECKEVSADDAILACGKQSPWKPACYHGNTVSTASVATITVKSMF